ncbi:hypothetical protein [Streptomyces violaceus]|uniref:Uncharacterized protein n=1 Tax=Streptomyces violaceus TaxID=1936 RepID=A0ABY9UAB2_STRVL|nr:hypothetical protein [Streptomyces janthinus]WND19848.1 hypothetical protein RI060_21930 [Streptomyces janthinus]GGS93009.1 hypothetical protein GCM10010270_76390 [Streptomyces janthinus]
MTQVPQSSKLVVVVNESGEIVAATWPGVRTEGAPLQTGMLLSEGQAAHEVELPEELYRTPQADLSGYRLRIDDQGRAAVKKDRG